MLSFEKAILDILLFLKKFLSTTFFFVRHPFRMLVQLRLENESEDRMNPVVYSFVCIIQYFIVASVLSNGFNGNAAKDYLQDATNFNLVQNAMLIIPIFASIYLILVIYCRLFRSNAFEEQFIRSVCWYWLAIGIIV